MFNHKCIRCKTEYTSKDQDAYLCEGCDANRLAIAREIDAKFNTVGQTPNSDLINYDRALKANGGKFPSLAQLGIK